MSMMIDAHIHPFIEAENSIAPFGTPLTLEEMMAELKACGFSKVCGSVIQRDPATWEDIQRLNRVALKIRDEYPDFYEPGVHVLASEPEKSCRELEYLRRECDVRWIGELVHYSMQTGLYNTSGMFAIYETARDLEMPVNIHCSDLDVIEDVLRNFPSMNLVIAHPEDVRNAKARFELVRKYPNACIDISGTGLFRWGMLRYAVDRCGSEKILFGSDFPVCSPGMNLGGFAAEHLTDAERENIICRNFLRLTRRA